MQFISPDESSVGSGGGPDDPTRLSGFIQRSQGFLLLAFGFALGLCLMAFFGIFRRFGAPPIAGLQEFVAQVNPNLWLTFLYGFVGGTVFSGIYNVLVVRRLNLFGLESSSD